MARNGLLSAVIEELWRRLRSIDHWPETEAEVKGVSRFLGRHNRERFRTFLALPLASLFLILLVCLFATQRPASTAVRMPLLRLRPPHTQMSCDGQWVFVELLDDGKVEVNLNPVSPEDLSATIGKLMETRAERVVLLVPSPGIPYARFVETLAALQESAPKTHVGVLTGTVRQQYEEPNITSPLQRIYTPCDIIWPANEFQGSQ